jgi:hypothetical protein
VNEYPLSRIRAINSEISVGLVSASPPSAKNGVAKRQSFQSGDTI